MAVLDTILEATRRELPALRQRRGELEARVASLAPPRPFSAALRAPCIRVLAEVKRRSPSAGEIRPDLDPVALARAYQRGGAAAVSVLTDRAHFGGSITDLERVAAAVAVPVLRKDFIVEEVQLLEARVAGAAAALLIVRVLSPFRLGKLLDYAASLSLEALVEAHDADEVAVALDAGARVVGVNARDLDTLATDTVRAWPLLAAIPSDCIAVAESGMHHASDVERAAGAGADAVLIGSALSSARDAEAAVGALTHVVRRGR